MNASAKNLYDVTRHITQKVPIRAISQTVRAAAMPSLIPRDKLAPDINPWQAFTHALMLSLI